RPQRPKQRRAELRETSAPPHTASEPALTDVSLRLQRREPLLDAFTHNLSNYNVDHVARGASKRDDDEALAIAVSTSIYDKEAEQRAAVTAESEAAAEVERALVLRGRLRLGLAIRPRPRCGTLGRAGALELAAGEVEGVQDAGPAAGPPDAVLPDVGRQAEPA